MTSERLPERLRRRVAADLAPVRPLRSPWLRLAALLPVVIVVLALANRRWGVRDDAAALGPAVLWGLSLLLVGLGMVLIGVALREAVPGLGLEPPTGRRLLLATGAAVTLVVLVSWSAGTAGVPPGRELFYWSYCFRWPYLLGLLVTAPALAMAWRAWPLHPARVGALCGLGAGLAVEGLWRTFCEVSRPGHVLGSHFLAVLASTLTGAALALALGWLRDRRQQGAAEP